MKKTKEYVYVPRREYKKFYHRCLTLLNQLTKKLKLRGIKTTLALVGSGKRHLVMQLVINGEKQAYDLDFNLEVDTAALPQKYRNLKLLKEVIRAEVNDVIHKADCFADGQDSTSAISVLLYFNDSPKVKFSFDIAIVSKNEDGDLQRLVHIKESDMYEWRLAKNTEDVERKAKLLNTATTWNQVREHYKNLRNKHIDDKEHYPAFICYAMAIHDVYNAESVRVSRNKEYASPLYQSHLNPNWDPVGDSAEDD